MAFAPSDIANLAGWWKADTIALSDGDAVTTWTDSSGNSKTLTATGTGAVYKTAGLNSLPTVRFPGTATNYLASDSVAVAQPATVLFVARRTAATSSTGTPLSCNPSTDVGFYITSAQLFGVWMNTGTELGTFSAPATVGHVFEAVMNGASSIVKLDGGGRVYSGGSSAFNTGITVGARYNRSGEWFDGDVAEIALYSRALGPLETFSVRAYLSEKYAVTVATDGLAIIPQPPRRP